MKTRYVLLSCVILYGNTASGNLSGADDFNDNTMDTSKWSVFMGDSLNEINSRLEYAGGTGDALGVWKWELNSGTYVQDWSISMDVMNAVEESGLSNQDINFGILAWNTSPNDNLFSIEFKVGDDADGSNPYRYIETSAEHNNVEVLSLQTPLSSDSARLQISFDASAKAFTGYYDSGSGLMVMTNCNIGSWGLTESDIFTVAIYGSSSDVSPASGQVYGDNFVAVPEPATIGLLLTAAGCILLTRHRQKHWSE